jgi:hypothetical protein
LCHSDGHTSEELTKQILNIAAILPGQQVDRRFSIPERKSSGTSRVDSQDQQVVSQKQQDNNTDDNLIDLQADPAPQQEGATAKKQGLPAVQKDLLGAVEQPDAVEKTNLVELSDGVQKLGVNENPAPRASRFEEPPQSPSLRRMDSETQAVDEFHDAES